VYVVFPCSSSSSCHYLFHFFLIFSIRLSFFSIPPFILVSIPRDLQNFLGIIYSSLASLTYSNPTVLIHQSIILFPAWYTLHFSPCPYFLLFLLFFYFFPLFGFFIYYSLPLPFRVKSIKRSRWSETWERRQISIHGWIVMPIYHYHTFTFSVVTHWGCGVGCNLCFGVW